MRERDAGLYDEKQRSDIIRAGITAWVLSIPAMLVLYLLHMNNIEGPGSILWFPYYLYVTLFVFSGATLYYNRG